MIHKPLAFYIVTSNKTVKSFLSVMFTSLLQHCANKKLSKKPVVATNSGIYIQCNEALCGYIVAIS
eukprot:snap_masked-scaffold_11-processed-gene-5.37-mRNA-1 protein AED:1.00 eAED:1.00 QI:0/0/0/0/1/1/3/0/65